MCRASIWTGTVILATATTVGTAMDKGDMVTGTGDTAITNRPVWRNARQLATGGDAIHRLPSCLCHSESGYDLRAGCLPRGCDTG